MGAVARGWLLCAGLLLGACSPAAEEGRTPALVWEPCELTGSQGQGRVAAECTRLEVAEDPQQPDGRRLSLFVARIRALTPEPAPDAFTLVNGGPGASSTELYVDLEPAFAAIRRERDIVIMDQRGTGRSAPLECPELEQATHDFEPARIHAAARACLAELDGDPRYYTTSVAVGDLERLRRALGYPRWNLYGVSYGTRVAQHYQQRYPEAVRTLVLDGVVPPDLALGPDISLNAQRSLDAIIGRCSESPACEARFPALAERFEALAAQLQAEPVEVHAADPVSGAARTVTLHYGHLAMTVRMLSYAPETVALIPLVIDEAAAGNFLPLATQALRIEQQLGEAISFGMHNSVVCTEDVPFYANLDAVMPALEASYLGADQVRALQTICEVWPAGPLHPKLRRPLEGEQPVLLLSGEHDPITPPAYAEQAASGLTNHRHLIAPGQGHGVLSRGCMPFLVSDFVASARPESIDASCLERLDHDPFFLDLMGPSP